MHGYHATHHIRDACFEGMTVNEAADLLGVNRVTLSRMINGRGAIFPEMALLLATCSSSRPLEASPLGPKALFTLHGFIFSHAGQARPQG